MGEKPIDPSIILIKLDQFEFRFFNFEGTSIESEAAKYI